NLKSGFLCVALAVLRFAAYTRLSSNSKGLLASDSRILGLKAWAVFWDGLPEIHHVHLHMCESA
ncbi:mCG1036931, isoform CRA_a, partial [Mus musculus]